MVFATFDPLTAPSNELIAWCKEASFIHGGEGFHGLVQPARDVVIKIGGRVTEQEARNQTYAYQQLKGTELQVPQVYRYFSSEQTSPRRGYIMMEYIPGRTMKKCMTDHDKNEALQVYGQLIFEATKILSKIAVPPLQAPGPVGGGEPRGFLFHEDCFGSRAEFRSIQQMNSWLNIRLQLAQDPSSKIRRCIDIHEQASSGVLDFQDADIIMVHGDLTPRHFILTDNGGLALLDWALAGFYPRIVELFSSTVREYWDPVLGNVSELLLGKGQLDDIFWKLRMVQLVNFYCIPEDLDRSLLQLPVPDSCV